jgi:hypothetical protein
MTQQPGRLDQLAVNILAHLIRTHVPAVAPVWDNGLGALVEYGMGKALPNLPVRTIRIGQVDVPLELLASFARAVKLLPEGQRVGA